MRKFEVKFYLKDKGFGLIGAFLNIMSEAHTQVIIADSERDAIKRIEQMYSDKKVDIISCKIAR